MLPSQGPEGDSHVLSCTLISRLCLQAGTLCGCHVLVMPSWLQLATIQFLALAACMAEADTFRSSSSWPTELCQMSSS